MITRRTILATVPVLLASSQLSAQEASPGDGRAASLDDVLADAQELEPLKVVLVSREGELLAERGFNGHAVDESTNIKSASKSIISAMVGIAISKGLLEGVDQKIAPLLEGDLPSDPDPRMSEITIGNLLSMQAGLARMSGPNYGRWVSSGNWVRTALSEPFDGEPGGQMLYSTASTHLLSAILTRVGEKSTLALAREWFEPVKGFRIGSWERDPQGVYLGGNQMAMTAASLLSFGQLYQNVIPEDWIRQSWTPRTISRFSGDGYGYGWFLRRIGGEEVKFGWGYGGQMLYIVPSLGLTVVMTSNENSPSARTGYRDDLHALLADIVGAIRSV